MQPGERGVYSFRSRLRSPDLWRRRDLSLYGERSLYRQPVDRSLRAGDRTSLYPLLVLPVGVLGFLVLCLLFLIPLRNIPTSSRATQTAAVIQTQTALSGTGMLTGMDCSTAKRLSAPILSSRIRMVMLDREEVEAHSTNPLDPDTDDDKLLDGDEIQTHKTDPRNPDMDGDARADGDEIAGGSDPRNPDTDGDGLRDGDEIKLEVDPRNPDSDGDGLKDGQENELPAPASRIRITTASPTAGTWSRATRPTRL